MNTQERDKLYAEIVELEKEQKWDAIADLCVRMSDLDLPDLEKCIALANAGTAHGHLKEIDKALTYFDKAIKLESRHKRFTALERKAGFLTEHNRLSESLAIYQELLGREDLYLTDVHRFSHNIQALENLIKSKSAE